MKGYKAVDVQMIDFETTMKIAGCGKNIDLLKLDIEGAEFDVLPQILKMTENGNTVIKQICLEWHDRFYKDGRKRLHTMKKTLNHNGYQLAYISEDGSTNAYVRMG